MKYLKYFENQYYTPLEGHVHMYSNSGGITSIKSPFTQEEFEIIKSQFDCVKQPLTIELNDYMIKIEYKYTWMFIYKTKDEWYYISNPLSKHKNYKCDQLEGLIHYIKDEIKNKEFHDVMQ